MSAEPERLIEEIVGGAAANAGEVVVFDVRFASGSVRRLLCPYRKLGHLLVFLQTLAKKAAGERAKHNPLQGRVDDADLIEPFHATRLASWTVEGSDCVGVQFQTDENISIDVLLSRDSAHKLVDSLTSALGEAENARAQKLH